MNHPSGTIKHILLALALFAALSCYEQPIRPPERPPRTRQYAGTYTLKAPSRRFQERVGTLAVYPESDSTILFYADIGTGSPVYANASFYGRVTVAGDSGVLQTVVFYKALDCTWRFRFSVAGLELRTGTDGHLCELRQMVYPDGFYVKVSADIPAYFENEDRQKIYFRKTKPEDYH